MSRPTEFMLWYLGAEALKGGAGSGNYGHAGRPGKVGGSQDQGGSNENNAIHEPGPAFDRAHWEGFAVPDRAGEWQKLPIEERDRLANAKYSIPHAIKNIIGLDRPEFSGDPEKDIKARLAQVKDLSLGDAHEKISSTVNELDGLLAKVKVAPEVRYKLGMEAVDSLAAQEYEAMSRQLGDHGIHHIRGNIEAALGIMDQVPGQDTDKDKAAAYITQIFHDTGYMTEPGRTVAMDQEHPRWAAEHYDENIRPTVVKALGNRQARAITHMITTHAETSIDWENDPIASAVRVADNTALFQREKLPGLFRYVPGNMDALVKLKAGKLDLASAKGVMTANIRGKNFSPKIEKALLKAVSEVNPATPKFTLGMLGGYVDSYKWRGDHIQIRLKRNQSADLQNKLLDLGQRQFGKLAEGYRQDPKQFTEKLNFTFANSEGRTLLEGIVI